MTAPPAPPALFDLTGRAALVVGGAGVLGLAIAEGLARCGARVAITSRGLDKAQRALDGLVERVGGEALAARLDATSADSVREALNDVEAAFGPVTILVNAAGGNAPGGTVAPGGSLFALRPDDMRAVVDMNLFAGAVVPCQVVGERMAMRDLPASIINVTSMAAERPLTRVVAYSAAKAAVTNYTRWLAVHFARDLKSRVRVNALAPGFFLTEQNRFLLAKDGEAANLTDRGRSILEHTPMGRFGDPAELAGAAAWLASDSSSFVTGAVIPVDGGFSAFSGV